MSERTAVYRLYGEADALLYVGISNHFGLRWEQHAKVQPWWPEGERQTVEWHPSREEALAAEKAAIKAEHPKFNVTHAPRPEVHARRPVVTTNLEQKPMAEARANLPEIAARTRFLRTSICLTRRGTPQVAIVPVELADAAEAVGGPDKAAELLRQIGGGVE